MPAHAQHDAFVGPFHERRVYAITSSTRTIGFGLGTTRMAETVVHLIIGLFELLFVIVWKWVPVACYFTAVLFVPAVTLGKVAVRFPRNAEKSGRLRQKGIDRTPEGKIILSPAFGSIIGFALLTFALTVAFVLRYSPSPA